MPRHASKFVAASLLCLTLPLQTWAAPLSCPAFVSTSSANLMIDVPPFWTVQNTRHKLANIGASFSDGPPAEMMILKPYDIRRKGSKSVETWRFEGTYPKGKWLNCSYEGRLVVLSQELPSETAQCSVTYKKKAGADLPETISVACR